MIRKILTALVLVPLAVLAIAFAVANRQMVVVSLDPFDTTNPAYSFSTPLFALILALLIGGVIVGGAAAWLRQGRWRRAARLAEWEARELRLELERCRRQSGSAEAAPGMPRSDYHSQLTHRPPAA